ncbi:50S ribosomal protein L16 [Candidatus Woesearchaeota archaeon]|nr:50S ribosomal protein L16 [Candidatus Woesearchaeota archaeon]
MAKKRKFCAYRRLERPYTRKSKFRKKSFVRASPVPKIVRFDMGNRAREDWDYSLSLVSKDNLNIRDNSLESARMVINKYFETQIGVENYHLRMKAYPHHMLRENPLASGAGADRMSTGMKMSFGKVIGIAARIKKGKEVFEIKTTKDFLEKAKIGLEKGIHRMPASFTIKVVKLQKQEKPIVA